MAKHIVLRFPTLAPRDLRFLLIAAVITLRAFLGLTDPDLWWHLKTGELIVSSHSLLSSDPFTWTASGHGLVLHEWLSEVLIYLLQSNFGYAFAVAVWAATIVATLAIVYRLALRICSRELVVAGLVALSTTMILNSTYVRPQIFTWLFFAIFVRQLYLNFLGERVSLWPLPFLMVLWSNMHLGYVFGLVAIWTWLISIFIRDPGAGVRGLRRPLLLAVLCSLAPAISPYGPKALFFPIYFLHNSSVALAAIQELASPNFHNIGFAGFPIAIAVLFLVGLPTGRRHAFGTLMLLIVFGLALFAVRNMPLFAIIFPIVAAQSLANGSLRHAVPPSVSRVGRNSINWAFLSLVVALMTTVALFSGDAQVHSQPNVSHGLPSDGVAYIRQHQLGTRMLNPFDWGGYLLAELYPQVKVSIYQRTDLYGDQSISDYVALISLKPGWREELAAMSPDFILLPKDSALAGELRYLSGWKLAFEGPVEVIFVPAGL